MPKPSKMKKSVFYVVMTLLLVISFSIFTSCREEKTTGEKIEEGVEDAGDAIEEGAEEVGDEIDDATDGN